METKNQGDLVEQLHDLIRAIETSGRAILPLNTDELLRSIVEAAARIFGAAGASLALVNEKEQTLEFKISYNAGDFDVVGMSIPVDRGIAGYVVMTGQPLSVSNVQQDPRFDRKFAESTGYIPNSILATPLFSGEQVIGVMEVLDKIDAASFGLQDMELLGIFASQAAIAIHQSQQQANLNEAFLIGLKRLSAEYSGGIDELVEELEQRRAQSFIDEEATSADLLILADLFNDLSNLGYAGRKACLDILRAFSDYSRSRPRYSR